MSADRATGTQARRRDAGFAAALLAIDPAGLGGVTLRSRSPGLVQRWMALFQAMFGDAGPVRRMPHHIDDDRLLGGLDLPATLGAGRPVLSRGLLAQTDGGVVVVPMAERLSAGMVARLSAAIDNGVVPLQRDGMAVRLPARIGLVAIDECAVDGEALSPALADRLALALDLDAGSAESLARDRRSGSDAFGPWEPQFTPRTVSAARARLRAVAAGDDAVVAICEASVALGIDSLRAPSLALRVARACAALHGRDAVCHDDVVLAARLVLAPRATSLPAPREPPPADAADPRGDEHPREPGDPAGDRGDGRRRQAPPTADGALADRVIQAAVAALPPNLLAALAARAAARRDPASDGRRGEARASVLRGRPNGVRQGGPAAGARLAVVETLRAAAPWQPLRRRVAGAGADTSRVVVRAGDFRVRRHQQRRATTTVFVVDASGSAAMHRLAEAKGAVELLLADCYARRDRVALLAFRGTGADRASLLLPPTRSLVRAKRCLAGQPGGGGTPLADGLDGARELAHSLRRRGDTPLLVLLTDGRANVARDGTPGRGRAQQDALESARAIRAAGLGALLLDISAQPHPQARQLADEMGATYLPLPRADPGRLSETVRAARPH